MLLTFLLHTVHLLFCVLFSSDAEVLCHLPALVDKQSYLIYCYSFFGSLFSLPVTLENVFPSSLTAPIKILLP